MIFEADEEIAIWVELHLKNLGVYQFEIRADKPWGMPPVHTVVGTTVDQLEKIYLEYNGMRFQYPIIRSKNGELKPIRVIGGRDHWSQMLREMAMREEENGDDN